MKIITRNQYLQLVGLTVLGTNHYKIVSDCVDSMTALMPETDPEDGRDRAWEIVFGDRELDEALRLIGITTEANSGEPQG